jgi:hypothetical protein
MPSAVSTEKIGSRIFVKSYDHDPGATTAIVVSPDGGTTKRTADMGLYERFAVLAKPTVVGAGGLTKLEIIASAAADMSNPVVVKDSGTVAGDALDDNVFAECTAAEVKTLGDTLRYVAGRLTMATATDEASVTYIGWPRNAKTGLTATVIT